MRNQIGHQLRHRRAFYAIGLLVCLLIAGITSFYASGAPDGLEKVASEKGFDNTAKDHTLAGWPLAGYDTQGIGDTRLSGGLAGIAGVGLTLLLAGGLFFLLTRRQDVPALDAAHAGTPTGPAPTAATPTAATPSPPPSPSPSPSPSPEV